MVTVGKCC